MSLSNVIDDVVQPAPNLSKPHKTTKATIDSGSLRMDIRRRIWIDIDNSPHVPFFIPIIEELRKRGDEVILTARDAYQVRELLELYRLPCKVVGRHYGKNRAAKILGTCVRATQLIPTMANPLAWYSFPNSAKALRR